MNCTRLRVSVRESRDVVIPCVVMPHRFPVIGSRPLLSTLSPPPRARRFSRMKRTTIPSRLLPFSWCLQTNRSVPYYSSASPLTWAYGNVDLSDSRGLYFTDHQTGRLTHEIPRSPMRSADATPPTTRIIADGCAAAGAVVAGEHATHRSCQFTPVSSIGTRMRPSTSWPNRAARTCT